MTTALESPPPATLEFDQARAEAFGERIFGALMDACTIMLMSVGQQTALFDTMSNLYAVTSTELATASGLQERYVREWLAGVVVAGVVEYDPVAKTYRLPPEHAASLVRAAGPGNLAQLAQYPAVFSVVEQDLIAAFRNGGGVPYASYPRFQQVQREESAAIYDATLVDVTLALVPGLAARLEQGIDVADFGCGSGHAINVMARAFPNSRFTGFDFQDQSLATARSEAAAWGLANATFEAADVAALSRPSAFDLVIAFDAIHDQADPARVLANIAASLRPGGTFLMVDIAGSSHLENNVGNPLAVMMYTASLFHCMTVSLAQGGAGLGTMWGEELATQMLTEAGFRDVATHRVDGDIANVYYVCSK